MKTSSEQQERLALNRPFCRHTRSQFILVCLLAVTLNTSAAESPRTFGSAEEAVSAFAAAVSMKDSATLQVLFGPAGQDLVNPDRVQATTEMETVTAAFNQQHRVVCPSDSQCVLEVGPDFWPFPVPIVKKDGRWFFDADAGRKEVLQRRIGKNELATLDAMRAYVGAQREYASRDRDGDEVLEYAGKIRSSPDKTDGLYWPQEVNGEVSPLGPWFAQAQAEGYFPQTDAPDAGPQPFHGYFFRILTRQGRHAPGGKHDYVINGNMIAGFAMIAWPAEYGHSGVMTFIVNQQGRVYQKDLGESTSKLVRRMRAYDTGAGWQVSPD